MPRYFFDIVNGGSDIDNEGNILANFEAARETAVRIAFDAAISAPPIDGEHPAVVTLRDSSGRTIHSVWIQVCEQAHT